MALKIPKDLATIEATLLGSVGIIIVLFFLAISPNAVTYYSATRSLTAFSPPYSSIASARILMPSAVASAFVSMALASPSALSIAALLCPSAMLISA